MVGFVVISHSQKLAEGVVELVRMMARDVKIEPAGGLEDGTAGTSFEKITAALDSAYSDDGVIFLVDMGSAVMTAEMVIESDPDKRVVIADCPVAEGAVLGAMLAESGSDIDEILEELAQVGSTSKLND